MNEPRRPQGAPNAESAVLALKGKSQLQEVHLMSETVDSVKEDVEWVKQQTQ